MDSWLYNFIIRYCCLDKPQRDCVCLWFRCLHLYYHIKKAFIKEDMTGIHNTYTTIVSCTMVIIFPLSHHSPPQYLPLLLLSLLLLL